VADQLSVNDMLASSVEPLRQFRWILSLNGIDAYTALSTERPHYTIGEIAVPYINTTRYLAGKLIFNEMKITLWDPIAPSAAQKVQQWVGLNYEILTGRSGYKDFYTKDFDLKLLDPPGGIAQQWQFKNAWPKDVNFGGLDYKSEEMANVDLSLRFDSCVLLF